MYEGTSVETRICFISTVLLKFLLFLWMITLFKPRVFWFIIYWYDYDWFTIDVSITTEFLKSEMDVEYAFKFTSFWDAVIEINNSLIKY